MIQIFTSSEVYLSTKSLKDFQLIQLLILVQENTMPNQNLVILKISLEMLKESVLLMKQLELQRKVEVLLIYNN